MAHTLYYRTVKRKDPGHPESEKFYASLVNFGTISLDQIAEAVAHRDGHTVGQVRGLIRDYMRQIEENLVNGKNIQIQPLGTLRCSYNGLGSDTEDDYELTRLTKIKIVFTPSTKVRKAISLEDKNITFKKFALTPPEAGDV